MTDIEGNVFNAHSGQKQPYNFGESFPQKLLLGKYLNEKRSADHYQQL